MVKFIRKVFGVLRDAVVIFGKVAWVFVRALGLATVLVAVASFVLAFALYGAGYFHSLTRWAIEKYMRQYTRTECRVGRVEGTLLTGLDIYDFRLADGPSLERDGPALLIEEIHVRYNPIHFIKRDATIDYIHCVRPWLVLREDPDGRINLDRIFGPKGPPKGKGVYFVITNVFLEDAYFKMELNSPLTEFSEADVRCTFTKARGAVFIDLRHCSCYFPEFDQRIPHFGSGSLAINARLMHFAGVDVASRSSTISTYGTIKFEPDTYLDLRFKGDPFDVGEVAQGVFDDPPEFFGTGRYTGTLKGPPERLVQSGTLLLHRGYLYGFDVERVTAFYDFDVARKQIRLRGFEGRLNGTPAYVKMTFDLSNDKPVYWGEARLLRMDLADYLHSGYFTTDVDTKIVFSGVGLTAGDYALDVSASLGPGQLGPVLIDGGIADFRYANEKAYISGLSLRLGEGGELFLRGSGDPEALDLEIATREVPLERFGLEDELSKLRGAVSIDGRITGSYAAPSFRGSAVFKRLAYERLSVGTARAEGYWENIGGDERAHLRLMAWEVQVGPVALARARADVTIEEDSYVVENGLLENEEGDYVRFDFAYDRPADRWEISRLDVNLGLMQAELVEPLILAREGRRYAVSGGPLRYRGGEFALRGTFGPEDEPLALTAEARGIPLEDLLPAEVGPTVGGRLDRITLDVGGTMEHPELYANLAASNLIVNRQPIDYIHGEASYDNQRLIIPGLVAGLLGGTLRVAAYLPLNALAGEGEENVDVTLWFSRFKMSAVTGLYKQGFVDEGYLDGVITVSGTGASPEIRANLLLSELAWGGVRFDRGRADFTYRDGVVDIRELSLAEKSLPNVMVTGRLPLALRPGAPEPTGEIDLAAEFVDLDLRALNLLTEEVLITGGVVRGRLELTGSYQDPVWAGRLAILDGEGVVRVLRSSFARLTGTVETARERVTVSPEAPLTFRLDEGGGQAWGSLAFEGFRPRELSLNVAVEDYVIRAFRGVQALGDIRANISGPLDRLEAVAEVELTSGLITTDFGEAAIGGGSASPSGLAYEVHVTAPGNLWLRNRDAEIELEADVTARRTGAVTVYTGELHARRGHYYFLQRDFQVLRADISFTGTQELNPVVALRAKRVIRALRAGNSDAVVYIDVTGTLREPVVALSYETITGETVGLSREEITRVVALDLTWDDYNALSAGELATKGSSDYVRRYAEAEVARAVRRETGVDVFEFDANVFTGTEENPYAEVTVGQHLTPDLFVSYTGRYREVGPEAGELVHAAEVDYELRRNLFVVGSTYEDNEELGTQRYGLGLRFIHKY
ncbi:MAG: translocation/assembly module TamB domain-containing protein [Candidatus Coatesbacteria bacterium]|nr:MAG: translocation/assembly module TamB domain-containing protein [Candidatus Coatesbacteria bacterium]